MDFFFSSFDLDGMTGAAFVTFSRSRRGAGRAERFDVTCHVLCQVTIRLQNQKKRRNTAFKPQVHRDKNTVFR